MSITVAGHVCLDIIPDWQKGGLESIVPGHLLEMEGIDFSTGGVVANTGLALKKLGMETKLIGKIGEDFLGKIILDILKEYGDNINESMIISPDESSSYTVVLNPPDTDRIFMHCPGPNHTFEAADISFKNKNSDLFHFGYPPLMKKMYINQGQELVKIFKKAKNKGFITSLDMAMPDPESKAGQVDWINILKKVLPFVDIFLPSINEILYMLEYDNYDIGEDELEIGLLEQVGKKLMQWGVNVVVLKLGSQGLYLQTDSLNKKCDLKEKINQQDWENKKYFAPCFEVEVKGTTGAGDSAIAGFLAQIIQGKSPENSLILAAAAGACSVEKVGATDGIQTISDIKDRIKAGWEKKPVSLNLKNWKYDDDTGIWQKGK